MIARFLQVFSLLIVFLSVGNSVPTSPTHQRLGSDEIRITPSNRDVCLAKLLCGMSVVTLEDAYNTGNKDGEIYGDYAQIVAKFFQENPPEEFDDDDSSLSAESLEAALEDYSVSAEDEEEEEISPIIEEYRPKRPELKRKVHKVKKRPAAPTTASTPVVVTKKITTQKPTPPGIQIFDMGMPVQEVTSKPKTPKALFHSLKFNGRVSRARKIMRRAGLATKLRTVRQCQRISGCTYTFKQLYQKYGGKGIIDELSQPMQPLHVVDEQWSRLPQGGAKPEPTAAGPFENPWISPVTPSPSPTPSMLPVDDVEYGGLNSKIPPALEAYFQASMKGNGGAKLTNPGTTYKIKKGQKQQTLAGIAKKQKRKKSTTTTTTEATTTTTTTTEPTTTITTTTTEAPPPPPPPPTTTIPSRRRVQYKRPRPKKRPANSDDDEDDNINHTGPVKLIGNREHDFDDETVDHRRHQVAYEDEDDDESVDDYDEEAKYNVPVDYGNDEEDSDEQDDEDDDEHKPAPTKRKRRPQRPMKHKSKTDNPIPEPTVENSGTMRERLPISPQLPKYQPRPPRPSGTKIVDEFQSIQTGHLKKLKKKRPPQESKENTSEEIEDTDDDFEDNEGPPPFEYPTHIGGRPIFPDYGISVTAYGVTRSTMQGDPRPQPPTSAPKKKVNKKYSERSQFPVSGYKYPPPQDIPSEQSGGTTDTGFGAGVEPSSGMSVLSPIKSLFKHLASGISPNPVGGGMGYTQSQSPSSLHYKMPPNFGGANPGMLGGKPGGGNFPPPPGITVPLKLEEGANPNVPQIAIMPQIPKGPESSEYKRPAKYTVKKLNKNKIPSL